MVALVQKMSWNFCMTSLNFLMSQVFWDNKAGRSRIVGFK